MLQRPRKRITPDNAVITAWICCLLFLGYLVGTVATDICRSNPVYFCQYSRDCLRINAVDTRCCRDVIDEERWTSYYVCRPACTD